MNEDMSISDAFHSWTHVKVEDVLFDFNKKYFKDKIIDLVGDTKNHNVLIIDDFGIYPKYRGKGLGKEVLQGRCGLIVLKSLPKQLEFDNDSKDANPMMQYDLLKQDEKKAQRKLNAFYKKCGFTKISTSDGYYFIMNIDQI